MAFEHKDGRGSIFRNKNQREGKQDAQFTGDGKIDGKMYWIDAWIEREENNGPVKRISLSFRPKQPRPTEQKPTEDRVARPSFKDMLDDEIPF